LGLIDPIVTEFAREAASTRRLLERVPFDNPEWQPHAKSMNLVRLASHVAEIPGWTRLILLQDELRFEPGEFKPTIASNLEELLEIHDKGVADAASILPGITDEQLGQTWTMIVGGHPAVQGPKLEILRDWAFSHMIHHRGQLSVYLRLLDVPLPGIYGPSADSQTALNS
jgi:uncharacterized damage-inducible protein DinB